MRLQSQLEGISESLRIPGSKSLGPIQSVRRPWDRAGMNNDLAFSDDASFQRHCNSLPLTTGVLPLVKPCGGLCVALVYGALTTGIALVLDFASNPQDSRGLRCARQPETCVHLQLIATPP